MVRAFVLRRDHAPAQQHRELGWWCAAALLLLSLLVVGDVDAGWVHMACHGRTLTTAALARGAASARVVVGSAEVKNGLDARRLHIVICASERGGCGYQVALIVELRGVRDRCLCVHPALALSLDPSQAHSEGVNRRTVCVCSV